MMETTTPTDAPHEKIRTMFEAPFSAYDEFSPRISSPQRLRCHPVGAKFARIIAQVDASAFSAGAVDRASAFVDAAGPYVVSTEISNVMRYILSGTSRPRAGDDADAVTVISTLLPMDIAHEVVKMVVERRARDDFRDLVARVVRARGRFVREMCIEYNHTVMTTNKLGHPSVDHLGLT
jgi:hypothetical protein